MVDSVVRKKLWRQIAALAIKITFSGNAIIGLLNILHLQGKIKNTVVTNIISGVLRSYIPCSKYTKAILNCSPSPT